MVPYTNTSGQRGFTIIEVILFFAITGLLILGVMLGIGYSVNQQRYRDSVNTYAALMQQQYDAVVNVANERGRESGTNRADGSGSVVCPSANPAAANVGTQGRSECTIIGRRVVSDGQTLTIEPVIARNDYNRLKEPFASLLNSLESSSVSFSEIDARVLIASDLDTYDSMRDVQPLAWQATSHAPGAAGTPLAYTMLIVRSPYSGAVRTYISTGDALASPYWNNLVTVANGQQGVTACIDGGLPTPKIAVEVAAGSANASGVKVQGGENGC